MVLGKWPLRLVLIGLAFTLQAYTVGNEKQQKIKFNELAWRYICKEATAKEKLIFIYVGADYCSACRRMETSLRSPKLGGFYNNAFVNVRFDAKDFIQHQRATSWGVTSVPTMVYLNEKREVVHMVTGFRDAEGMMREAQIAMEKSGKSIHIPIEIADEVEEIETGNPCDEDKTEMKPVETPEETK